MSKKKSIFPNLLTFHEIVSDHSAKSSRSRLITGLIIQKTYKGSIKLTFIFFNKKTFIFLNILYNKNYHVTETYKIYVLKLSINLDILNKITIINKPFIDFWMS
jgi:hypothetical protein